MSRRKQAEKRRARALQAAKVNLPAPRPKNKRWRRCTRNPFDAKGMREAIMFGALSSFASHVIGSILKGRGLDRGLAAAMGNLEAGAAPDLDDGVLDATEVC